MVCEMVALGMTYAAIGAHLGGISRQRIEQIIHPDRRRARRARLNRAKRGNKSS